MPLSAKQLVQMIHAAPTRLVAAVTGGGSRAISDLLEVPGASRTLLEASVPYTDRAMVEYLGGRPDQFCAATTGRAMAMVAFGRAMQLAPAGTTVAGIACTAGLATDRPKAGPHRAHIAMQTAAKTLGWSLELAKDRRARAEEERLVGRLVLNAMAEACHVERRLELELFEGEEVRTVAVEAPLPWQDLILGRTECIAQGGAKPAGGVIFSGAFNPMHHGHRGIIDCAAQLLGEPVAVEVSVVNVDKPPLDYVEIARRVEQFPPEQPLWLTRAATFDEKSRLFPGATFLVGADTLRRIIDPRYHGGDEAACQAALRRIADRGCRFLVFGRDMGTGFVRLSDIEMPDLLRRLCRDVPAEQFREDISSTALRRAVEE